MSIKLYIYIYIYIYIALYVHHNIYFRIETGSCNPLTRKKGQLVLLLNPLTLQYLLKVFLKILQSSGTSDLQGVVVMTSRQDGCGFMSLYKMIVATRHTQLRMARILGLLIRVTELYKIPLIKEKTKKEF